MGEVEEYVCLCVFMLICVYVQGQGDSGDLPAIYEQ